MLTREKLTAWRGARDKKVVAALCGIPASTWNGIENGTRLPNLTQSFAIEKGTGGVVKAKEWPGQPVEAPLKFREKKSSKSRGRKAA